MYQFRERKSGQWITTSEQRLPRLHRASRASSVYMHCSVPYRLISPAAVNHFSSVAVQGFFPAEDLVLGGSTCVLGMDLTSNISDLPQRNPIFWTYLSTQCSFYQPMVCCFHQRRNVAEERHVAFLVYQIYLCGRCPLTCQMVRLSHSLGTSVEQSRV